MRTIFLCCLLMPFMPLAGFGQTTPIATSSEGVGYSNVFFPVWSTRVYTNEFMAFHPRDYGQCIVSTDGKTVFCGTKVGKLIALRSIDGGYIWSFRTRGAIRTRPYVLDDSIFFGSADGCVYRVDVKTGKAVWKKPYCTDNPIHGDVIVDYDRVLFSVSINKVYAISVKDGELIWEYHREKPEFMSAEGCSSPVPSNGSVYVGFSDGVLASLDINNGRPIWTSILAKGKNTDIDATPVVDGDKIYTGSFGEGPVAISANDGSVIWRARFFGVSTPLLADGLVVVGTAEGDVVALKRDTGETRFITRLKDTSASRPIRVGGMLVVATNHGLVGLDPMDGTPLSSLFIPMGVQESPYAFGQTVFFVGGGGFIHAVEIKRTCISFLGTGSVCP